MRQRFALELSTATWRAIDTHGAPPAPRVGHSSTQLGADMYIIGGFSKGKYFHDVHVLNVESLAWSQHVTTGSSPHGRVSHSAPVSTRARRSVICTAVSLTATEALAGGQPARLTTTCPGFLPERRVPSTAATEVSLATKVASGVTSVPSAEADSSVCW